MPQICLYFQLHQPYRLENYNVFDIGSKKSYFSKDNKKIFDKVSQKSYLPMLSLLLKLVNKHKKFRFALSCSGVFLEQAIAYKPQVIRLLQKLVETGRVELLAETYYHSLASLYSEAEFKKQVKKHNRLIKKLFKYQPTVFRNTELIYNNYIAYQVEKMGYQGIITEAVERYLGDRDRTMIYLSHSPKSLPLLLKHAQLSDDIAFRFSDKSWVEYPLTVKKYLDWIEIYPKNHVVNLFMDFETFGEHQWEETGVFSFFEKFVKEFIKGKENKFVNPSELIKFQNLSKLDTYDVGKPISWADVNRDLTAWVDNDFQRDCIEKIYRLEAVVLGSKNRRIIEKWRYLQTSDNFYYMCTKWSNDGDVHAYFSPFDSPFEAYRHYSIVLADFVIKLEKENQLEQETSK